MRRAVFVLILFAATPAWAQDERPATPEVMSAVFACANIQDTTQRLACYDGAVGRLRAAEASGEVMAVDSAQAETI